MLINRASVIAVSIGRLVALVRAGRAFQIDVTCTSHRVQSTHSLTPTDPGATVPFTIWALSEGPVSVISICVPNMVHLINRARQHGVKALFTRRDMPLPVGGRSNSRVLLGQRELVVRRHACTGIGRQHTFESSAKMEEQGHGDSM